MIIGYSTIITLSIYGYILKSISIKTYGGSKGSSGTVGKSKRYRIVFFCLKIEEGIYRMWFIYNAVVPLSTIELLYSWVVTSYLLEAACISVAGPASHNAFLFIDHKLSTISLSFAGDQLVLHILIDAEFGSVDIVKYRFCHR